MNFWANKVEREKKQRREKKAQLVAKKGERASERRPGEETRSASLGDSLGPPSISITVQRRAGLELLVRNSARGGKKERERERVCSERKKRKERESVCAIYKAMEGEAWIQIDPPGRPHNPENIPPNPVPHLASLDPFLLLHWYSFRVVERGGSEGGRVTRLVCKVGTVCSKNGAGLVTLAQEGFSTRG